MVSSGALLPTRPCTYGALMEEALTVQGHCGEQFCYSLA